MSLADANREIRAALDAAGARRAVVSRERTLWQLEADLEELLAQGCRRLPRSFSYPVALADSDRIWLSARGVVIAKLIDCILSDLLPQPAEADEFHGCFECGVPLREGHLGTFCSTACVAAFHRLDLTAVEQRARAGRLRATTHSRADYMRKWRARQPPASAA